MLVSSFGYVFPCHLLPAIRYVSAAHVMSEADSKRSLPMYLLALGSDRTNVAAWTDLSVNAGKAGKHKLAQWAALGNLAINPTADAHFLAANSFMYCLLHSRCFIYLPSLHGSAGAIFTYICIQGNSPVG